MSTGYGWEGIRQVCATLLGARHVPERLWGGSVYTCGAIQVLDLYLFTFTWEEGSELAPDRTEYRQRVAQCGMNRTDRDDKDELMTFVSLARTSSSSVRHTVQYAFIHHGVPTERGWRQRLPCCWIQTRLRQLITEQSSGWFPLTGLALIARSVVSFGDSLTLLGLRHTCSAVFLLTTRNSAKLTDQRGSYAFTCSPLSIRVRHILPTLTQIFLYITYFR